jgi:DNA mismatch repair protein MLH3
MTSKCKSLKDLQTNLCHFGFRGEALSSITEVCGTLTIVSRCRDSDETNCKVFTQGVPHHAGKSRQQRQSCGTTITVSDFLYNRPVRRARVKAALDLEEIKTHMESIALINPHVS